MESKQNVKGSRKSSMENAKEFVDIAIIGFVVDSYNDFCRIFNQPNMLIM